MKCSFHIIEVNGQRESLMQPERPLGINEIQVDLQLAKMILYFSFLPRSIPKIKSEGLTG